MNLKLINGVFEEFKNELTSINKWLLKAINAKEGDDYFDYSKSNYFYNGIIISIYGIFESYIDKLCLCYIDIILQLKEYINENAASIKNKILETYLQNVTEYVQNPQRHTNIDYTDSLVSTLFDGYSFAQKENDYSKIDSRFLIFHSANMKSMELFNLFKKIGIEDVGIKICSNHTFLSFIKNDLGLEEKDISLMKTSNNSMIYNTLNNLVDQRNSVAHTAFSENKLSLSSISGVTIPFLQSFFSSLKDIFFSTVALNFKLENTIYFLDRCIIKVYNDVLVCHSNENNCISKGDLLIFDSPNGMFLANILSVGLNNDIVASTKKDAVYDYCFKVDVNIKETYSLIAFIKMN